MPPDSRSKVKVKAKSAPAKKPQPPVVEKKQPPTPVIPLELQQLLLNIFRNSFAEILASDIGPVLQEIKRHLYNRDFATAFGKDSYLEAYAARWSPSRALGYLHIFWEMREFFYVNENSEEKKSLAGQSEAEAVERSRKKVVCLGGGAGAEIVALAALQSLLCNLDEEDGAKQRFVEIETLAIDIADWAGVVKKLDEAITTPPPLSKYASAAVQAASHALIHPGDIKISFEQQDIFTACSIGALSPLKDANIVTLLFTLNELYSTSLSATQQFLLGMTEILSPGSILLVVDSPGSYSSVTLNGAEKNVPHAVAARPYFC